MPPKIVTFLRPWLFPSIKRKVGLFFIIFLLLIGCYGLVYITGGTHKGYLHVFYIPLVLGGTFFSISFGIGLGIFIGLLIGPSMPLDVTAGVEQPLLSWLVRLTLFTLIGGLSGVGSGAFRAYLKEIERRLTTNLLTGLPNLYGLERIFKKVPKSDTTTLLVVLIAVKNLTEIERALGIGAVEKLVQQVAENLRKLQVNSLGVGHLSLEEFVLILPQKESVEESLLNLQKKIDTSYVINDIPVFVEIFWSASLYPRHGLHLDDLIKKAQVSSDIAHSQGISTAIYSRKYQEKVIENVKLLHELNQAIQEKTLEIYYQPKINLSSGRIVSVEALTRWNHPLRGMIPPDRFIPLAERTLLIHPFTRWMVHQALQDLSDWQARNLPLTLAVNFSMRNFYEPQLFDEVFELLRAYKIPNHMLEIEVTESAVPPDVAQVAQILKFLRAQGLKITIDDFGTGQASQHYLYELPLDGLKIDKLFVRAMITSPKAETIVKNAILLGHQMNLEVTAEGVETKQQLERLKELKCDLGQGFFIGKPLSRKNFEEWLEHHIAQRKLH